MVVVNDNHGNNELSLPDTHYSGESPASFTAEVGHKIYLFDAANWIFSTMMETAEHSIMRGWGIKQFSTALQQEKMNLRGETLVFVLDNMLTFHCGCQARNKNVALMIAGYPNNNNKKLEKAKYDVHHSSIENPPS